MHLDNDIVLRPRFKTELDKNNILILDAFKTSQSNFIISCVDAHVFIRYPKNEQHFWTPQLHLEINAINDTKSIVKGLYGPNPTVWTMFMFLHFIVACLFIAFGIWSYTNWSLGNSFIMQLSVTCITVLIWFALYFSGRIGKASGKPEMIALQQFMNNVLKNI